MASQTRIIENQRHCEQSCGQRIEEHKALGPESLSEIKEIEEKIVGDDDGEEEVESIVNEGVHFQYRLRLEIMGHESGLTDNVIDE
jgi:hypothetical protein